MNRLSFIRASGHERRGLIVDTKDDHTVYYVEWSADDELPYSLIDPPDNAVIGRALDVEGVMAIAEQHHQAAAIADAWDYVDDEGDQDPLVVRPDDGHDVGYEA